MHMNNTKIYRLFIYVVYLQGGENFAIMHGVEQRGLTQKRVEPHFFILFLRSVLLLITLLGKSEGCQIYHQLLPQKNEREVIYFGNKSESRFLAFEKTYEKFAICRKKHHEGERIC